MPAARRVFSALGVPARAAEPALEEIIAGLEAAEEKVHRVHVKNFDATWEEQKDGEAEWKATPLRYSGSAWYDLGDEEASFDWIRGRIWFDKMVMRWEQGAAPFYDGPVDIAFDGEVGTSISLAVQTTKKGRVIRDNTATLTADAPMLLRGRESGRASGIGFSTQLFNQFAGSHPPRPRQPLSRMLGDAMKGNRPPVISSEGVNDVDAVRLRWEVPAGQGSSTLWFDPARAFALVRYEMRVNIPASENYELLDVTELKEAAPGVWFPTAGTFEMSDPDPAAKRRTRMTYKAEEVAVNDAVKWDADFFKPKIPAGYMVADVRNERVVDGVPTGRISYIVMPGATTRPVKAGDALPAVKAQDPQRPD
jgi:hypothetical protein